MHPILIAGAALIGLPILLHLIMKQEPKRQVFPAFRFLKLKQRINQRKMRLRHFVLLALRMLIIGLFALTLYQPTVLSEGLNLTSGQPVAAVIIVDTSPSMGYRVNDKTRLEEARHRALELIDDLPEGSRIAVLDSSEAGGEWLRSRDDARSRVKRLEQPSGLAQTLMSSIAQGLNLFKTADAEFDSTEPLPRLIALFTDRTVPCWDAGQTESLRKLRESVGEPQPVFVVVDVGSDAPVNVAISAVDISPQVVAANAAAVISVSLSAVGADVEAGLLCRLDSGPAQRRTIPLPAGQTRNVTFEYKDLPAGLHQVEVMLETPDKLMVDNTRYLTFRVAEPRPILTIADAVADAHLWNLALSASGDFASASATPEQAAALDWRKYAAVVLLSVADPSRPPANPLWPQLLKYVQGGGKLLIIPGGDDQLNRASYDPSQPTPEDAANLLMPAQLQEVIEHRQGVPWLLDDRALQHPMLADLRAWKQLGNIDIFTNPRRVRKYWKAEPLPGARVIVRYAEDREPGPGSPALIERDVGKGQVLLLTTRMDVTEKGQEWNDYWETAGTSWYVVFPNLLARYLAGRKEDANFNYLTGQRVVLSLGALEGPVERVVLEGPGVATADETFIRLAENQREIVLGSDRTRVPGNYRISRESKDDRGQTTLQVMDGFSLNVPTEESLLEKVPVATIEELTGPNSIVAMERNLRLTDLLSETMPHPVELFPWLLIAVLLLLAGEGLLANRFYPPRRQPQPNR